VDGVLFSGSLINWLLLIFCIIYLFDAMVEAQNNEDELQDKTFIEEPAILDKYKAAALIADGKSANLNFWFLIDFNPSLKSHTSLFLECLTFTVFRGDEEGCRSLRPWR